MLPKGGPMKQLARIICLTVVLCFNPIGQAQARDEGAALLAARDFLGLMDEAAFLAAYDAASEVLRLSYQAQDWVDQATLRQKRLGQVIQRRLMKTRQVASFPNLPDGEYALFFFESQTRRKLRAMEIVLVESGGYWPVVAYYELK